MSEASRNTDRSTGVRNLTYIIAIVASMLGTGTLSAANVYKSDKAELNVDLNGAIGGFNSERSYAGASLTKAGNQTWFEGYGIYGLSGSIKTKSAGEWFGAFRLFSGASKGDPDAIGFSIGDEYQTQIEDGYIGWRSGDVIPWLGHDGLKISAGRQNLVVGTGFLINNDMIYPGKGFAPDFERGGGTVYLGGRSSFGNTAVLDIGQDTGIHFKGFWLRSDNKFQAEESLVGGNLEYNDSKFGGVGFTYLRGLHVSRYAGDIMGEGYREGQNVWSIYGHTNFGIKELDVAGQYVREAKGQYRATNIRDGRGHAWYVSAGWIFTAVAWEPKITYRFIRFSRNYDPLFYGLTDIGTWYQGEVASTYAGPFNTASNIQMIRLTASPSKALMIGVNGYSFTATPSGSLNAKELDLYAFWTMNEHITVLPLLGLYNPSKSIATGGSQFGGMGTNVYTEVLVFFSF